MSNIRKAERFVTSSENIFRSAIVYNFYHQTLNNTKLLEFLATCAHVETIRRLKRSIVAVLTSRGQAKRLVYKLDGQIAHGFLFRVELLVVATKGVSDTDEARSEALKVISKAESSKYVIELSPLPPKNNGIVLASSSSHKTVSESTSQGPAFSNLKKPEQDPVLKHLNGRKDFQNAVVVLAVLGCESEAEFVTSYCIHFIEELVKSLPIDQSPILLLRVVNDPATLRRLNSVLLADSVRFCVALTKNNASTRTCSVFSLFNETFDKPLEQVSITHAMAQLVLALNGPPFSNVTCVNHLVEMEMIFHENSLLFLVYDCFSTYISIDFIDIPKASSSVSVEEVASHFANHITAFLQTNWTTVIGTPKVLASHTAESEQMKQALQNMDIAFKHLSRIEVLSPTFLGIFCAIRAQRSLGLQEWMHFAWDCVQIHNHGPCPKPNLNRNSPHEIFYDSKYFLKKYE